jgi:DNA-3-methyladenine glycosylase
MNGKISSDDLLGQEFFARDALDVAYDLLGKFLRHESVIMRISEVEAYRFPHDSANHCRMGRTPRNDVMWGVGGHTYIYLCYGMHQMLNIVTGGEGEGEAVLIRSCEPVADLETIGARRGGKRGPVTLTGPGKVSQALGLDASFNALPLFERGGLEIIGGPKPAGVLVGPRVGIDYATKKDRNAKWRIGLAESVWVSHAKGLKPPHQRNEHWQKWRSRPKTT